MRGFLAGRFDRSKWATIAYVAVGVVGLTLLVVSAPNAIRTITGGDEEDCAPARDVNVGQVCVITPAGGPSAREGTAGGGFRSVVGHPGAVNFQPDKTRIASCDTDGLCYEQAFGNLTYDRGPRVALPLLERLSRRNATVQGNCHRIGHSMGSAALMRYDGSVARAFAEGQASCWSGYYHGILERAFKYVVTKDAMISKSRGLCADRGIRKTVWLAYQCVHGLGHGLMIHTGYALPFSLDVCDKLPTEWDQTSCTGGVFMENINSSFGAKSLWLRDDDGVYPCRNVRVSAKNFCYSMSTSRILEVNGGNWEDTAQTCRNVERRWVDVCFQSMGRDASGRTRARPDAVTSLCRYAREYAPQCLFGAARDFTAQFAGGERAGRLCDMAPAQVQGQCYFNVGSILGAMSRTTAKRRRDCRKVTRRYAESCEEGAATVPDIVAPGRAPTNARASAPRPARDRAQPSGA